MRKNLRQLLIMLLAITLFFACSEEEPIDTKPVAAFTVNETEVITGTTVQFKDASFDQNGSINSWSWDFGNGEVSDEQSPSYTYVSAGEYTVLLTVTDNTGNVNVNDFSELISAVEPSTATTLPTVKWSYDVAARTKAASPVIGDDGTIYFGNDGKEGIPNFFAVNADGSEKWTFECGDIIRAAPGIGADGTVYIGSYDNFLHAFSPSGSELWAYDLGNNAKYAGAIATADGIFIGSQSDELHAVSSDGIGKWKFAVGADVDGTPAIDADGTLYVGATNGKFYAINADGTEKWAVDYGSWTATATAIADDGTIVFAGEGNSADATFGGVLIAFNAADGTEKWRVNVNNKINQGGPAIAADGTVYAGGYDNEMVAYNGADGSILWSYPVETAILCTPAIDNDGNIYFGDNNGWLHVVAPDGTKKWKELNLSDGYEGEAIWSSPAIGSDGTIYITASTSDASGRLYAITTNATGLATGGWPMVSGNPKHTGQ